MVRGYLAHLADTALDLLFPRRCALCGGEGAFLCASCAATLPRLSEPLCNTCGLPLGVGPAEAPKGVRPACGACAARPLPLEGLRSLWAMEGPARQLVHQLKYGGLRALAPALAGDLARLLREWAPPIDVIAPVPLHPRRLRERGFDQADLLARSLAGEMGIPAVSALRRVRATAPQANALDRPQRWRNVADAFACVVPEAVRGRRVLLIDDVATTVATLAAAAGALRDGAAPAGIWAVTLTREV